MTTDINTSSNTNILPHPTIYVGHLNSHHPDWGYTDADSLNTLLRWIKRCPPTSLWNIRGPWNSWPPHWITKHSREEQMGRDCSGAKFHPFQQEMLEPHPSCWSCRETRAQTDPLSHLTKLWPINLLLQRQPKKNTPEELFKLDWSCKTNNPKITVTQWV